VDNKKMASPKDMRSNYQLEPILEKGTGYFYAPTPRLAKVRVSPCLMGGGFFSSLLYNVYNLTNQRYQK